MKKNKLLIPLLMLCPMLMANSPAPYPTLETYYGLQVTGSNTGRTNTAGETLYDITVNNVGDRNIIPLSSVTGQLHNSITYSHSFSWNYYTANIFEKWAIAPGNSVSFTTPIYGNTISDFSQYTWYVSTYYIECPNITIENMALSKEAGFHTYKLNGNVSNLDDYYYSAIVEVVYKGENLAFEASITKGSSRVVKTKEELDLSKLEIKKATVYRSSYNTYKNKVHPYTYIAIAVMVGIVLFVGAAIAVPIIIVTTRKRNKNKYIGK